MPSTAYEEELGKLLRQPEGFVRYYDAALKYGNSGEKVRAEVFDAFGLNLDASYEAERIAG